MQTTLFHTDTRDASFIQAKREYDELKSKGAKVCLVYVKTEKRYSVSFNNPEFIIRKLKSIYKLIPQ